MTLVQSFCNISSAIFCQKVKIQTTGDNDRESTTYLGTINSFCEAVFVTLMLGIYYQQWTLECEKYRKHPTPHVKQSFPSQTFFPNYIIFLYESFKSKRKLCGTIISLLAIYSRITNSSMSYKIFAN